MYIVLNKCYQMSHGCLFGYPVHNLQSLIGYAAFELAEKECYSIAPSDYEQVSSKIHPLRFHICY